MNKQNYAQLDLRRKTRKATEDRIFDSSDLSLGDYKYLFYLAPLVGSVDGRERSQQFLNTIKAKINGDEEKLTSNEAISTYLALKLAEDNENLLDYINNFLEKRTDIQYSPLSDINNIFFLSNCYSLLSENLKQTLQKKVSKRLENKNIPIYEFVLLIKSIKHLPQDLPSQESITSRLTSYDSEELCSEDYVYVEWLYQTLLKVYLDKEDQVRLKHFLEKLRSEYLLDINESASVIKHSEKSEEVKKRPFNLFVLTLLYEATSALRGDFRILSPQELKNEIEDETESKSEEITSLNLQVYETASLLTLFACLSIVQFLFWIDLPQEPFNLQKIIVSLVIGASSFIEIDLFMRLLEEKEKMPVSVERFWEWENKSWIIRIVSVIVAWVLTYYLLT